MTDAGSIDHRRYRRRILGWGLLVLAVAFAVPAVFALRWVEDDLESRVPEALADAGIEGVQASFSGQDGTLLCETPLADSANAVEVAGDVDGVRSIGVDASCTASAADAGVGDQPTDTSADDADDADDAGDDVIEGSDEPVATIEEVEPDVETIAGVIADDPQFRQLSSLLTRTGLDDTLAVGGPFTMLAPTDDAFDVTFEALGADAFQDFVSDEDRMRALLLHHVTTGALGSSDFDAGPLTMLDGTTVAVTRDDTDALTFTSGDVVARPVDADQVDIEVGNGYLHAIDRVLPASVIADEADQTAMGLVLELGADRVVLAGVVTSQAQRSVIVSALQTAVGGADLVDELIVDATSLMTDAEVDRVGAILGAFPDQLSAGLVTVDQNGVRLTGVVVDDAAGDAVRALAEELGVTVDLSVGEQSDDPNVDTEAIDELQRALDELVLDSPIEFEADSTEIAESSADAVDEAAALVLAVQAEVGDALLVTIVGHTDSDGDADRNLLISEGRALRVRDELVAARVSETVLVGEGRGETEPVIGPDGQEAKDASRRVEFVVGVAPR